MEASAAQSEASIALAEAADALAEEEEVRRRGRRRTFPPHSVLLGRPEGEERANLYVEGFNTDGSAFDTSDVREARV